MVYCPIYSANHAPDHPLGLASEMLIAFYVAGLKAPIKYFRALGGLLSDFA